MQLSLRFRRVRPLRPFFSFYGAKWRLARRYPPPRHRRIVEPFAGSASYALHFPDREVSLFDLDENVATVWSYLIAARESEILSLPLIKPGQHVSELGLTHEARLLVGFWLNKASPAPRNIPSAWMRRPDYASQFWGERVRHRIATQLQYIRHWKIRHGSYCSAPDCVATWFIDPPYQRKGSRYTCGSSSIDYPSLAAWSRSRPGQAIVCEQEGADWLQFRPFHSIPSMACSSPGAKRRSKEVVALFDNPGC